MSLNEATQSRIQKLNHTEFAGLPDNKEVYSPITLAEVKEFKLDESTDAYLAK